MCAPLTPVSHPGVWLAGAEKVGPPSHSTCSQRLQRRRQAVPAASRRLSQLPPPGGEPDPPERHQDGARPAGQGDGARYWRQEAHAREGALPELHLLRHTMHTMPAYCAYYSCMPIKPQGALLWQHQEHRLSCQRCASTPSPPLLQTPLPPPTRRSAHEPSGQPPATALLRAGGGGSGEGHSEGRAAGVGGESRRGSLEAEPTAYFHGLGASVSYVYRYESSAGALSARGVCICICAQVSREPPEGSDSEEGALEVALTAASEVVSDSDSV